MDWVRAALSTFLLAWAASLWHKLDPLRGWLGVWHVLDPQTGEAVDRADGGGLGGWLNCPLCAVVLMAWPGWILKDVLAHAGLAVLIMRWFEGARVKARWWT